MSILEKIKNGLTPKDIDQSFFVNNPDAEKTSWDCLVNGSSNFCSHKLQYDDMGNFATFKSTWMNIAVGIFIIAFPMIFPIVFIYKELTRYNFDVINTIQSYNFELFHLVVIAFLSIFIYSGASMIFKAVWQKTVFCREIGGFYKSTKSHNTVSDYTTLDNFVSFDDIMALQIIDRCVRNKNTSYYSYELNIVKKDGSRINVVYHGNYKQIKKDGESVAEFIGVPLWECTNLCQKL